MALTSKEFYGALALHFKRAPITVRKRLALKPAKVVIENGRAKYYFTAKQLHDAKAQLSTPGSFVGRGNHNNHRRGK